MYVEDAGPVGPRDARCMEVAQTCRNEIPTVTLFSTAGAGPISPSSSSRAQSKGPLFMMTKAKFMGLFVAFAIIGSLVMPLRAAEAQPQSYVVLVGVSDYADKQIQSRPHAEADAKAMFDLFTSTDHLNVPRSNVRLLLGKADTKRKSEPATHDNIVKALNWAVTSAKRDDLLIVAMFGQGAALRDRTCYFGSDSTYKDRAKNAVPATVIEAEIKNLKSLNFCVFLDVNFEGVQPTDEPAPKPNIGTPPYREFLGPDDEENPRIGRVVFLATPSGAKSIDLKDHGIFAKVILDGLRGSADKEGYEPDGLITVDELSEYLNKELPPLADKHGTNDRERRQQHWVLGGQTSHFVLSKNPAVQAKVQERLKKLAVLGTEGSVTPELAEEGAGLLRRMPKLKAYQTLRQKYQALVDAKLSVEDFTKERTTLLAGLKLPRTTAREFAAKVIQATQMVRESYIKPLNQGEMVVWAVRGLYRRIDEQIPGELRERLDKASKLSEKELTVLLTDARERLGQREDLDNQKDVSYALQRMLSHLDPYTTFIDSEALRRFQQETTGRFSGIGIQIRPNTGRDLLEVVTPIRGSPAYKKGLKAGDLILSIMPRIEDAQGNKIEKPDVIPGKGLNINDAVKRILGEPGTKVRLIVERKGEAEPLEFEITRDVVEVETVLGHRRNDDDSWDFYVDPSSKIAYVRLTTFARNTARELSRVMKQLDEKGINGLVLDLRFNPGGLLTSAVEICDLFVSDGLIVTIKPRVGREARYPGRKGTDYVNFPMVCLVNGHSASGSEIVAACLQDHYRAVIIGERSYGKGSVQNIQPFEGGELKLTTATFHRPNGKNLNKASSSGKEEEDWGVVPDDGFTLKLSLNERDQLYEHQRDQEIIARRDLAPKETKNGFKDRQLESALNYLRGQIKTVGKAPADKTG
jgi:carboxyl-terminal processing protease